MVGPSKVFWIFAGIIVAILLALAPAFSQSGIPSFGEGSCEIIVFTDYFCPPCKRTDEKAESLVKKMLATGKVKITFVDVPFNRATPMYAKYYLYAVNADADANRALNVRRLLFAAAQEKRILTEDALAGYLKKNKIDFKPMDEKTVFSLFEGAFKSLRIDRTPTWVVRCASDDEKKYVGEKEILNGLAELQKKLKTEKNKRRP